MMKRENIVCFAKDWTEDPTSNNHVMRLLAKDNKVLWLNSISTRAPTLSSGRDLRKIGAKLRSFARGAERVDGGLEVFTPIVLPFPHSVAARAVNRQLVKRTLAALRHARKMAEFQLWSFLPTAAEYVGELGESLSVYYCTDEWSRFSYVDRGRILAMERRLCERADLVFTTARTLLESKRRYNPETHLASHGVDHAHFALALSDETRVPDDVAVLPGPVIGFVGLIQDWVDLELITYLADRRKDWSFVMIGPSLVDTSRLAARSNVHLLGRRRYAELPAYLKRFDVALIPFALTELTRNVNPIKLREYMSAGLPVVSTDIPEVALFSKEREGSTVARSKEEFLAAVERALGQGGALARRGRSDSMRSESWEEKVRALGAHVLRVRAKKGA